VVEQILVRDLPTSEKEEPSTLAKGCIVKKYIGKWGPYLYAVTKKNGKQTWKYLGRADGLAPRVGKTRRPHAEGPTTSEEIEQQERML